MEGLPSAGGVPLAVPGPDFTGQGNPNWQHRGAQQQQQLQVWDNPGMGRQVGGGGLNGMASPDMPLGGIRTSPTMGPGSVPPSPLGSVAASPGMNGLRQGSMGPGMSPAGPGMSPAGSGMGPSPSCGAGGRGPGGSTWGPGMAGGAMGGGRSGGPVGPRMAPGPWGRFGNGMGLPAVFQANHMLTPLTRILQSVNVQRRRPKDNSIEFWRAFVDEFFSPGAMMRWSIAGMYASSIPPAKRTMVAVAESLPRLFQAKYETGLMEELLFLGPASEKAMPNGHTAVLFDSLMEESVFEERRVIRVGRLRVLFNSSLRIRLWEMVVEGHCHMIPHRRVADQLMQMRQLCHAIHEHTMKASRTDEAEGSQHESLQDLQQEMAILSNQMAAQLDQASTASVRMTKPFTSCMQIADIVWMLQDLMAMCNQAPEIAPREAMKIYAQEYAKTVEGQQRPVPVPDPMSDVAPDVLMYQQIGPMDVHPPRAGAANPGAYFGGIGPPRKGTGKRDDGMN